MLIRVIMTALVMITIMIVILKLIVAMIAALKLIPVLIPPILMMIEIRTWSSLLSMYQLILEDVMV